MAPLKRPMAFLDEPTDISLVQGGPLFELLARARLLRPPTELVARRIVAFILIAWLPPFLLSGLSGHAVGGVCRSCTTLAHRPGFSWACRSCWRQRWLFHE
jgi:hypothetical protein